MILGVISDTHDRLPPIDAAFQFFMKHTVDAAVHCGEWKSLQTMAYFAEQAAALSLPVKAVLGNNDVEKSAYLAYARQAPGAFELADEELTFTSGGRTIVVHHGHRQPVLRRIFSEDRFDILLLGHTHKPRIEVRGDKLIVNPGSTAFSIPRSKNFQPSVALVDTAMVTATLHSL